MENTVLLHLSKKNTKYIGTKSTNSPWMRMPRDFKKPGRSKTFFSWQKMFFPMGTLGFFLYKPMFARDLPFWGLVGICVSFFFGLWCYQIFEMKFCSDVFSYFSFMSSGRSLWELFPTEASVNDSTTWHLFNLLRFQPVGNQLFSDVTWNQSLWSTEYYGAMTYQATNVMGTVYKIQVTSASPSPANWVSSSPKNCGTWFNSWARRAK